MAVLQPSAYAGIQEALKQRADLASSAPPSTLGIAANVAGKAAGAYAGTKVANTMENDQQKDLLTFKTKLQDELDRNQIKYKAQGDGKTFYDQKAINDYWTQHTGDITHAPQVGDGIYLSPEEPEKLLKHAQFQAAVQKEADNLLQSKDPGDQRRGKFLSIVSNLPDDKLEHVTDDLRKVLVPESDGKKAHLTNYVDPDTNERMQRNDDTGEVIALSGPRNRPAGGKLVTQPEQLYNKEKTAIEKAKTDVQKQVKPITDVVDTANSLIADINKNSPNTLTNIRAEVARLAGIPGSRMGFQFLQQEGLNRGMAQTVEQAFTKVEGKQALSPDNQKALLDYIENKKKEKITQLKNTIEDNASRVTLPDVHPDLVKSELTKSYGRYVGFSVKGPNGETGTVPKKGQKLPKGWEYVE